MQVSIILLLHYLIKIELCHDSLKWICDARDILARNVLEKDGYHNYHRDGFHFDLLNFLRCSLARILRLSPEVVLFSVQLSTFRDKVQIMGS